MLTQEYIKEALSYDPETGVFNWRKDRPLSHFKNKHGRKIWQSKFATTKVGCVNNMGYLMIGLPGKAQLAHRLAWLYVHGKMPANSIDHINGSTLDNRISNLRSVTHSENCRNQKRRITNTSGVTGVYWNKATSSWRARIKVDGKGIHLGLFESLDDAVAARKAAEAEHGFHANHGRII